MDGRIGRHIRSNVVGYVALFIALGGVTYAAGLAKDSVKSKQIKKGAVRSEEVKDDALTGVDVNESSLVLPQETAQSVLDKLKTVDGQGSGLSADSLDSLDSSNLYTRDDSDARFPVADASFSMVSAGTAGSYIPFVNWAELILACDGGGVPSVALSNGSGANLRVYTDTGDPAPATTAGPLANGATTAATAGTAGDGTADHVTYLTRGPLGTVRLEVWYENLAGSTNCLFNVQALGQAIGLTLAG